MNLKLKISAALVLLLAGSGAWLHHNPPELLRVGSNYSAKIVCSNVFLAHRDADEVLRVDVQSPGNPILKLMQVTVDREHGIVRAGLLGFIGNGLAVYRPGTGCAAVPDGNIAQAQKFQFTADALPAPSPNEAWPQGSGMVLNEKVNHLLQNDQLTGPSMRGVAVISHGRLIAQRYGPGFTEDTPLLGWSMTKTVNAALVGLQVGAGRLALDQDHFWPDSGDGREKIKLADLLAMSSGLEFNEEYGDVSDVTRMLYLEPDMNRYVYNKPLQHVPGSYWNYSSGTSVLLARLWMATVEQDPLQFPRTHLFAPLGMHSALIEADESGTFTGGSYMYATAQDWARFGQFLLQDGVWNGQQLLPAEYVAMMRSPAPASKGKYGRGQLWLEGPEAKDTAPDANPDTPFQLPKDIYWMQGHDTQVVAIIPSLQLVVVRLGLTPADLYYQPQALVAEIIKALQP